MKHNLFSAGHLELVSAQGVSSPGAGWSGTATGARAASTEEARRSPSPPHRAAPDAKRAAPGLFTLAVAALRSWRRRARERRELSELDDRMLRDIGLTREQLAGERSQSFWPE